ncbi:phycobiliprotein lyase [Leptothoe spongobia]|uniref:Chromophore lyase CpcS/CpeS n=1 Tax=Leptothoe spongobia TAU-MAC 1115 TaxID=1967444 RepID=A0A947DD14_9CYAN|nr:phycobiliprotein lyase [Leptothoe spongobia]MBT9314254.1 phycobiliprotein lyase [Leptothoe spongobia TAU-MAC 1115]
MNFFKKQGGRWFSQRTTHYLKAGESKAGKSDLEITYLDAAEAGVLKLCEDGHCSAADVFAGLRVVQKSSIIGGATRSQSMTVVAIATDTSTGQLVRQVPGQSTPQTSQYQLENGVLTIKTEANGISAEERWWFITDNLRMRTNVLSDGTGQIMASFCSEIRLGDVKA